MMNRDAENKLADLLSEVDEVIQEIDEMIQESDGLTAHNKIERVTRVQPQADDSPDLEQADPPKDHKTHGPPVPSMRQRRRQRLYPTGRIAGRREK
jgi:hypothetical protein